MHGRARAPSPQTALDGLAPTGNGLGPERVVEIQRARMLAAMVGVSSERGAGNVTVAHVVDHARVSRRTFYELFNDREECFLAAFEEGVARAYAYVVASYDPTARWAERIRAALTGLLSFLDVERDMGQLLIVGSLGAGANVLERRRRIFNQMVAVVDQGRDESKAGKELPPLTAEGLVGGVLSVLDSRLLAAQSRAIGDLLTGDFSPTDGPRPHSTDPAGGASLLELTGQLMSMIVLPYLGPAAARKELARPVCVPRSPRESVAVGPDPLRELGMRLTYRTVRVLLAVAATPGGSNRQVADEAGISDQGQISKLLARLHGLGLIENTTAPATRGAPNAWVLTQRGWEVQAALARNVA
jgi:AcrR family transcriptional regulator